MVEYIDREAAFETITDLAGKAPTRSAYEAVWKSARALKKIPAADVVPVVHGEWLLRHEGHGHYWECSVCHKNPCIYVTKDTNYCPNCGAKMDGGEENV